ncbi:MAG: PhnD/SsuA/transferrin family substrate-binding protein [Candidatus Thiodiazotropha sp.]
MLIVGRLFLLAGLTLFWIAGPCSATETATRPPIKVGGSAESLHESTRTDAEIAFQMVFNEMLVDRGEHFAIKIYDNNLQLIDKFKRNDIQVIFIDSASYLDIEDWVHPVGRYTLQFGPNLKQRYLLLVGNDSGLNSLEDLRGRSLSHCLGHRIGMRFLDVALMEQGLPESSKYFADSRVMENMNSAVVDVYFGKSDAALVPEYGFELAKELNPQVGKQLKVIGASEPLIVITVGLYKNFSEPRIRRVEPSFLSEKPTRRLQSMLNRFHITRFVRLTDEVLQETRSVNERYHQLKGRQPGN